MTERYGAAPEEWDHLSLLLGLTADLLPVVSNLNARISPDSKMKALGKTPSRYNRQRYAAGIKDWTSHKATSAEIAAWAAEPDYGICIQTRTVRAFDIDVDGNPDLVKQIVEQITAAAGIYLPTRYRTNSSKCLLAFQLAGDIPKRIIRLDGGAGIIEFLATGQQFVACGTHPSGERYRWMHGTASGLPDDVPVLTLEQVETIWSGLASRYGISEEMAAPTKAKVLGEAVGNDDTAVYLRDNGWVKSIAKDGRMHITCPFEAEHTGESAESATTYFPAHTGGYAQGHFMCLHAHCANREDDEFRSEIGMPVEDPFDGFFPLGEEDAGDSEEGEGAINAINASSQSPDVHDSRTANTPEQAKKLRFQVVPAHEFADRKPPGWIVKGVLPKASLAVIFGDSGSGKSFLAIDVGAAIARGIDWRDHHVKQGKVAYICAEGAGGMRTRLRAYASHHGIDLHDLDIGVIPDAPNFMQVQDVKDLILSIQAFGRVSVIIVDTFAQVMPGANENAGEDVGKALEHCRQLHKYTGALVILIHHSGKDTTKGARGWSGLRAAADAEIEIVRCDDDRVATVTKMKDGADGAEFGFKLAVVPLGFDEDNDEITSCVIDYAEVKPKEGRRPHSKLGSNEKLVLQCLNSLLEVGDAGVAYQDLLNAATAQMVPPEEGKRDRRGQLVSQAVDSLREKGSVTIENGFVKLPNTLDEEVA